MKAACARPASVLCPSPHATAYTNLGKAQVYAASGETDRRVQPDAVGVGALLPLVLIPGRPCTLEQMTMAESGRVGITPKSWTAQLHRGVMHLGKRWYVISAFVIKGEDVRWIPAMDVSRIIRGFQLVVIVALLSWRSVAKARARS